MVRPLFRFFNGLPQFTKQTKRLSETALRVREALFGARDPDLLLFEEASPGLRHRTVSVDRRGQHRER